MKPFFLFILLIPIVACEKIDLGNAPLNEGVEIRISNDSGFDIDVFKMTVTYDNIERELHFESLADGTHSDFLSIEGLNFMYYEGTTDGPYYFGHHFHAVIDGKPALELLYGICGTGLVAGTSTKDRFDCKITYLDPDNGNFWMEITKL